MPTFAAPTPLTRPAGWFEFRLAVLDDPDKSIPITQELLNEHVLEIDPSTIDYERVTDYQAVRESVRCPSSGGHSDPSAAALTATFPHGSCCNGGGACTPPDANRDRYVVDDAAFGNTYTIALKVPVGISCERCVLQWYYQTGNRPDSYPEAFWNCADISIEPAGYAGGVGCDSPGPKEMPVTPAPTQPKSGWCENPWQGGDCIACATDIDCPTGRACWSESSCDYPIKCGETAACQGATCGPTSELCSGDMEACSSFSASCQEWCGACAATAACAIDLPDYPAGTVRNDCSCDCSSCGGGTPFDSCIFQTKAPLPPPPSVSTSHPPPPSPNPPWQFPDIGGGPLHAADELSALSTIVGAYTEEGGAAAEVPVCVMLTATTTPTVDLRRTSYGARQQRSAHERQQLYAGVLEHWLRIRPPLPTMLVETSGDDLTWANKTAARLELHPLTRAAHCTIRDEIGCHEADAMWRAVRASRLIGRGAGRGLGTQQCSHVLKVTGRYAVISDVHAALRRCGPRWDVAVQNTSWGKRGPGSMVFGFRADLNDALFGWSQLGGQGCQECHLQKWVRQHPNARVCQLPRLRVRPVIEGSTGRERSIV